MKDQQKLKRMDLWVGVYLKERTHQETQANEAVQAFDAKFDYDNRTIAERLREQRVQIENDEILSDLRKTAEEFNISSQVLNDPCDEDSTLYMDDIVTPKNTKIYPWHLWILVIIVGSVVGVTLAKFIEYIL